MYEIETEDFYEDIKSDVETKFDTSDFPEDHPSGIERCNKKVIGMMKDEAAGMIIEEFVGLPAKLYSYRIYERGGKKKCKGVKKVVVKKKISHQDCKDCLFSGRLQMRKMNVIRSHRREIFTETVNKVALSANDDKQVILLGSTQCHMVTRNTRCTRTRTRVRPNKMNHDNIPFNALIVGPTNSDKTKYLVEILSSEFRGNSITRSFSDRGFAEDDGEFFVLTPHQDR